MASDTQQTQAIVDELVGNAHGNLARVKELVIQHPELLNAKATWDETPIQAATQMGNKSIIDFLLGWGAPLDFFTALVLGRLERIDGELQADPHLAAARGIHDLPALYFAAIGGNIEAAERLIAAGADVNARAQAAAPIHGAVMGGSAEMVHLLLSHGADRAAPDYSDRDALTLARELNRTEIVELLS
jgi:ankyrin repeat protein